MRTVYLVMAVFEVEAESGLAAETLLDDSGLAIDDTGGTVCVAASVFGSRQEDDNAEDPPPPRPRAVCGCGYELVWVGGRWEHNAAASLWGGDHDADPDPPAPTDPARMFWDTQDEVDG